MRKKIPVSLVGRNKSDMSATTKPAASRAAWDDIVWEDVLLEMKKHVQSNSYATNALRKLTERGCPERSILRDLYLFCGVEPEKMKKVRKALANQKEQILSIAKTLRQASTGIDFAEGYIFELGVECHFTPDARNLLEYAKLLERLHDRVLPPKKRLSGRDQHLAYLARMVKANMGREHYRELADLVNAVELAYNPKLHKPRGEQALRKLVDRTSLVCHSTFELKELRDSMRRKVPKIR
jgi:hypothetical protein